MSATEFSSDIGAVNRIDAVPIILRMVKQMTGMRFAAVARVTESHWVACAVDDALEFGLKPGGQLVVDSTICHGIRQHRQPVVFGHASQHPVYSRHPTPHGYKLESYISIPIIQADGHFFGTLCAIDPAPAEIEDPGLLDTLNLFAQLIATNLDLQRSLDLKTHALSDAEEAGRLREQFIAVLGHDLRTPLSAIRMSADLLQTQVVGQRQQRLVHAIGQSSQRMSALIEDVLDFARGRLGDGITVRRVWVEDLQGYLRTVVDEVLASHPGCRINVDLQLGTGIYCDPARMGQLLSNLLGNAVTHGAQQAPVELVVRIEEGDVMLAVANQGEPIPESLLPLLFQPFTRCEAGARGEGLGLGLYIAAQIMQGHEGTLSVSSDARHGTCFVARFPVRQTPAAIM
ncbi:histidine kinase [Pseudomonas sp. Leaf127]|uniref:GAF domain-containing sensor histidine kinase n=1 Tax=Pseudomonas sp. Leaf127 TaxID=1736267 RepID=UPI0007029BA2|nr:GAF domain-containing sensor histidine kinase [Pseudomonas sp. Leaf127]KQQ67892.1 histidine kinase [Pseudomonas sp. Leaf127]